MVAAAIPGYEGKEGAEEIFFSANCVLFNDSGRGVVGFPSFFL